MQFQGCRNVKIDGVEQFARDAIASGGISTPEQDELHALEYTVMGFTYECRRGDAEEIAAYLAESCTGSVEGKDWGFRDIQTFLPEVTPDQIRQIREQGRADFSVRLSEWDGIEQKEIGYLNFTVIQENGEYKISDYYLEQNEA